MIGYFDPGRVGYGLDDNGIVNIIISDSITGGAGKYAGATRSLTTNATASIESPTGRASY